MPSSGTCTATSNVHESVRISRRACSLHTVVKQAKTPLRRRTLQGTVVVKDQVAYIDLFRYSERTVEHLKRLLVVEKAALAGKVASSAWSRLNEAEMAAGSTKASSSSLRHSHSSSWST